MESFDLALLQEVGLGGTRGGRGRWGALSPGKGQAGILTPSLRCGVSKTSST